MLKKNLQNNLSETSATELDEVVKVLPETFEISELQIEKLKNLSSEALSSYLTTNSKENIKQAIFDFIQE